MHMANVWATIKDKQSIGIAISRWGPTYWRTLNYVTFGSDNKVFLLSTFLKLINTLRDIIPGPSCASHFAAYLFAHPASGISSKDEAQSWLVNFHNSVNMTAAKKNPTMSETDVRLITHSEIEIGLDVVTMWEFVLINIALYSPVKQIPLMEICTAFHSLLPDKGSSQIVSEFSSIISTSVSQEQALLHVIAFSETDPSLVASGPLTKQFFMQNFLSPGMYPAYGIKRDDKTPEYQQLSDEFNRKMKLGHQTQPLAANKVASEPSRLKISIPVVVFAVGVILLITWLSVSSRRRRQRVRVAPANSSTSNSSRRLVPPSSGSKVTSGL